MAKTSLRFALSVDEPWDFGRSGGTRVINTVLLGVVNGPNLTYWQDRYLLLAPEQPLTIEGEEVTQLIAAPRYEGVSVDQIASVGGTVGAARVKPDSSLEPGGHFQPDEVVYCIIGQLAPVD